MTDSWVSKTAHASRSILRTRPFPSKQGPRKKNTLPPKPHRPKARKDFCANHPPRSAFSIVTLHGMRETACDSGASTLLRDSHFAEGKETVSPPLRLSLAASVCKKRASAHHRLVHTHPHTDTDTSTRTRTDTAPASQLPKEVEAFLAAAAEQKGPGAVARGEIPSALLGIVLQPYDVFSLPTRKMSVNPPPETKKKNR